MTAHHHKQPVLLLVIALLLLLVLQAEADGLLVPSSGVVSNNQTGAASRCLPGQAAALLRLKRSFATTKVSNTTFASWRAGTDCCRWDSVKCCGHGGGGRVTSLDLSGRHLRSAALDPAIFNLTSLRYLNLAHNDFNTSELPSVGFERLTQLTHLNLSNANFSGAIPADSIGRLVNLVSIDLSVGVDVYLDDSPQPQLQVPNLESLIANLKNLRELRLDSADMFESDSGAYWCSAVAKHTPNLRLLSLQYCSISGPICESFSALRSLAVLDLRMNMLSGPVPDFFANMPSLRVLQLSNNDLEGQFPSIILQHTKLVTVDLSVNWISGKLPRFSAGSNLQKLLLSGTNFSGEIPSSIGNLKSLKQLDLGSEGFSGTIPSSIGKLRSLELLALSGLGLVGPIPSWIGNLTSLTVLQLSNCGLSESVAKLAMNEPRCPAQELKELTLSSCKFYGNIPTTISNLTQLEILDLQSNNFFGTVELSLFMRLPNLFTLSLSNNNLVVVDGQDNSSLVYPRINYVHLASCGLEKLPKVLRHLGQDHNNFAELDISQNRIQGVIPQWVWENWSGLYFQYLNLSHNYFTRFAGLESFLPFSVDQFDISFNMFEGQIPLPLPQDQRSTVLDYSSNMFSSLPHNFSINTFIFRASTNNLSGTILASFCGLRVRMIDISYNNLSGTIPSCLMDGTNELRVLNLKKNRLHGELPHNNISENCKLVALDFGDNIIKGKLPTSLAACKHLHILDIQNNQIVDSFPCWMSALVNLVALVLRSNKFFGHVGPSSARNNHSCEFPTMRILDLASNNFSGPLTEEWLRKLVSMMDGSSWPPASVTFLGGQLPYQVTTELTYKGSDHIIQKVLMRNLPFLDVSNNDFRGSIPAAIGELVSLHMVNMSYNSLTGPIPSQLGNLTWLETLDLSSNELSGEIPRELALLDSLTMLNLSNNKLVGSIPESPHFMTFSNGSFLGNTGLCGPPLSKECTNGTTQSVVSYHSKKNYVDVMLFLFSGIGFGVGFAIAIVVAWGIPINKKRS
ncbi:unnamed protein product [Urochloa decumbens]|uniref:Leucine-rich repeat-containing N-terminal plant-type domain-containing protein n=1 Tax=Urochloa decumbens TaxID=240449 RepID=A0ABC9ARP9_9POAL